MTRLQMSLVLSLSMASCAGCALAASEVPPPATPVEIEEEKPPTKAYVCQWVKHVEANGVSLVGEGNPKNKTLDELTASGVGFELKAVTKMRCRAVDTSEEVSDDVAPSPKSRDRNDPILVRR